MSCFLVTSATIDDVVALLADFTDGPTDLDDLGRALWEANADAVRRRYAHLPETKREVREMACAVAAYRFEEPGTSARQRRKSLACLVYNMAEGDVPEGELYRRLAAIDAIFEKRVPLATCVAEVWDRQPAHEGD